MLLPVHLADVIARLTESNHQHLTITTPSGTALGGWADLELSPDGKVVFSGHMHDSGWDPYDFRVLAVAQSPDMAIVFQHSGHVDGTGSDPLGKPNRDHDWNETSKNPLIPANWVSMRAADISISKSYSDVGVLGTAEDIGKLVAGWWAAESLFGPVVAVVLVAGAELGKITDVKFADPSGLLGVAVVGSAVLVFGPNVILPAVIAGIAVGASLSHRRMKDDEKALAALVFGDTLPTDRIVLTNLSGLGGRGFTIPSFDNSILVNLGDAFENTFGPAKGYNTGGQLLIHELTHAWQIEHADFVPGWLCDAAAVQIRNYWPFKEDVYSPGVAGREWHRFTIEQQATVVDQWFGENAKDWSNIDDAKTKLSLPAAVTHRYYPYINSVLRLGAG
jgi:hypothetical protein